MLKISADEAAAAEAAAAAAAEAAVAGAAAAAVGEHAAWCSAALPRVLGALPRGLVAATLQRYDALQAGFKKEPA